MNSKKVFFTLVRMTLTFRFYNKYSNVERCIDLITFPNKPIEKRASPKNEDEHLKITVGYEYEQKIQIR